jgi:hypothetical protein
LTSSIAEPHPQPVLRRLGEILPSPEPAGAGPAAAATGPSPAGPGASAQVEQILRAAVEMLGGRRPARQLATVLDPDLLTYLTGLQATAGHLQPRVRKVLARPQGTRTLEAVALITLRTGVRALAARFEQDAPGSRWRCTALQLRLTRGDMAVRRR